MQNDCELLLGCDYALLREEFARLRMQALEKRKNTKIIKNITYKVIQQLDDNFNITVVLGSSSTHNEMIKNYAKGRNVKVIIGAENMVIIDVKC